MRSLALLSSALLGQAVASSSPEGPLVPEVKLSNGVKMPVMAFAAEVWEAEMCRNATAAALSAGFRFVWSSTLVGEDCQRAQQEAISASGLERGELFVAGTVNTKACSDAETCYRQTLSGAKGQLDVLRLATLDMLMLDYPAAAGCEAIAGQWKAFEELYSQGKARSIAVSNFSPEQLRCVKEHHTVTLPTVNQMPFSVGHGKDTVVEDNAVYGIVVQAYSPLGTGQLARDETCKSIGRKHGKSAVQVALRWIVQRSVTIATQSTNPKHLADDLDIFDFELSGEDMAQLNSHTAALNTLVV